MTNLVRTTKPKCNRRALANQAMQAAIVIRAKAKLDQHGPICIYGLAETLGVTVRFNNITWKGCTNALHHREYTSRRAARYPDAPITARMNSGITLSATARQSTSYVRTPRSIIGKIQRSFSPTFSRASR